jgi:hypothetical protein
MRRVSNPGGTPSISANIQLTVPTTASPINPPASGSTTNPDVVDDRLFQARIQRDRTSGQDYLWTAHTIQVNASGVGNGTGGRDGSRWYQIGSLTTTPSLVQSGTLFDSAATNPMNYWSASCIASGQGHMAIGCSASSAVQFISAQAGGRLLSDPAGSTQSPTVLIAGGSAYTQAGSGRNRWGDYSATMVDPVDDQTIWTFQEYADAGGNVWATRATKLLAPPPASISGASPSTLTQGQTGVPILISGASVNGSGFYDTAPGFNRLQAAFSGTGITVTNISFTDPTHLTLTCDIAAAAPTGDHSLTITDPDGQHAVSVANLVTVVSSGSICPSFSQNPSTVTTCDGTQAQFTVAADGTPAPTYVWRRNTVPLTDGGNISGSGTPTLTINPAGAADVGSYDCVATNDCGSTPSTAASLVINSAPSIGTQPSPLTVTAGQPANFTVGASNATSFQWRLNTTPLADGPNISGSSTASLTILAASPSDQGSYDCIVSNGCGPTGTSPAALTVTTCYANCDNSTTPPVLNVLDFSCFLNRFAAGDTYANCDGSTTPPVLNVLDFACFLNAFAAGCS